MTESQSDALAIVIIVFLGVALAILLPILIGYNKNQNRYQSKKSVWATLTQSFPSSFSPTSQLQIDTTKYNGSFSELLPLAIVSIDSVNRKLAVTVAVDTPNDYHLETDFIDFEEILGGEIVQGNSAIHYNANALLLPFTANGEARKSQQVEFLSYMIKLNKLDQPIYWIVLSEKQIKNSTPEYAQLMRNATQLDAIIKKIVEENNRL